MSGCVLGHSIIENMRTREVDGVNEPLLLEIQN